MLRRTKLGSRATCIIVIPKSLDTWISSPRLVQCMQHGEVVGGKVGSWLVAPHEGVVWTNWNGAGWGVGGEGGWGSSQLPLLLALCPGIGIQRLKKQQPGTERQWN